MSVGDGPLIQYCVNVGSYSRLVSIPVWVFSYISLYVYNS